MQVKFKMEKATKNTIRFTEVLEHDLDTPKIRTIYVPKATLRSAGWSEGKDLVVELSVNE